MMLATQTSERRVGLAPRSRASVALPRFAQFARGHKSLAPKGLRRRGQPADRPSCMSWKVPETHTLGRFKVPTAKRMSGLESGRPPLIPQPVSYSGCGQRGDPGVRWAPARGSCGMDRSSNPRAEAPSGEPRGWDVADAGRAL